MNRNELFVPGRLCLFGEHSDWAGEYRKTDSTVSTGKCIITGTDQGIYATAEPAKEGFHLTRLDGSEHYYPSDPSILERTARLGNFDSYAAGTASLILRNHPAAGLRLSIRKRDLPLKKGLSSSAAISVLTARAFSLTHHLNFTIEEEMEFAFQGELLTGSLCGRMDQACAFGHKPVMLTFDGDSMTAEPIIAGNPLYFLVVDLNASKNTRKILYDLNSAFQNGNSQIRDALGKHNHIITDAAVQAIETGDSETLGRLMTEAQKVFDSMVAPLCPGELTAPVLHNTLLMDSASEYTWGGKGVGSQGDGAAQFICRGREERNAFRQRLEDNSGFSCYDLTIKTEQIQTDIFEV